MIMWMVKRNGGMYEPEIQVWMRLPMILICPLGILMFGNCMILRRVCGARANGD